MVRFFSNVAGLIPACFALVLGAVHLGQHQEVVFASAWSLGLSLLVVAGGSYFTFCLVRFLSLMLALRLVRGASAVSFSHLTECRTLATWLAYDWHFVGEGGLQHGERLLGLEVAYSGKLS